MEVPEIAKFARNFSVMVRVQGPDPKGLKMRRNAFHLHQLGKTTVSASGLLLLPSSFHQIPKVIARILNIHQFSGALVVTVASVLQPFLITEHRYKLTQEFSPRLIHDACIDVLAERVKTGGICEEFDAPPKWLPAKLLALVDVPAASDALLSLIGGQSSWVALSPLAPSNSSQALGFDDFEVKGGNEMSRNGIALEESNSPMLLAKLTTRIAFLGITTSDLKDRPCIDISQCQNKGDLIVVMGSPFGVLSPGHFYNSVSVGILANCCASGSGHSSLLVADIHSLPGMEGSPVFDRDSRLAGILTRPLRQKGSNAEIQFVVAWNAIASINTETLLSEVQNTHVEVIKRSENNNHVTSSDELYDHRSLECLIRNPVIYSPSSSLQAAISSVVLIAVGEGSWASGIVLNKSGLILTNAHTLEPWRFGRTSRMGLIMEASSRNVRETSLGQQVNLFEEKTGRLECSVVGHREQISSLGRKSSRRISIRVNFMERKEWYNAQAVYVSKGPLDVALVQLDFIPSLLPITPQSACPSKGSAVYVIGHGLLGPQSKVSSSISSGVLSNIVVVPGPIDICGTDEAGKKINLPIMLQTTAAVHPGASGGAVVNMNGQMIGLVTRIISLQACQARARIPTANFLEICDTFKYNGVSDDAIRLRLFPFSLRDRAKSWLNTLPGESISTWDDLTHKFLAKYFSPRKTAKLRIVISNFFQFEDETYNAWERFKDLLRRCHHHGLPLWMQVQTFYNGLINTTHTLIDAASDGTIMSKTQEEAYNLLEEMASNNYQWQSNQAYHKKPVSAIGENDQIVNLTAQLANLTQKLNTLGLNVVQVTSCDFCGGPHQTTSCLTNNPFCSATDGASKSG